MLASLIFRRKGVPITEFGELAELIPRPCGRRPHPGRSLQPPAFAVELPGFLLQSGVVHPIEKAFNKLPENRWFAWQWIGIFYYRSQFQACYLQRPKRTSFPELTHGTDSLAL
jgi:hypothetical protein